VKIKKKHQNHKTCLGGCPPCAVQQYKRATTPLLPQQPRYIWSNNRNE